GNDFVGNATDFAQRRALFKKCVEIRHCFFSLSLLTGARNGPFHKSTLEIKQGWTGFFDDVLARAFRFFLTLPGCYFWLFLLLFARTHDADLVIFIDQHLLLLAELLQIQAALFVEQLALFIQMRGTAVGDPLGERGSAGPLGYRYRQALLEIGQEALDMAI